MPNYWLLGLLLVVALAVRLAFWLPTWQAGDFYNSYAPAAHRLLMGEYRPGTEYVYGWFSGMRLGIVVPVAMLVDVFGYTVPIQALYPLACSILTLLLIYLIGLRLERLYPHAAVLAVAFGAVYPLLVTQAPLVLHDTPRTLYTMAAIFFFLRARERGYDRLHLVISGVAAGLSYLCSIGVFFMLPGMALWLVLQKEVRVRLLYVLAGLLLTVIAETVILSITTGEIFLRLSALLQSVHDAHIPKILKEYYPGVSRYLPGYWEAFLSPTSSYFILHGFSGWIAIASVAWSIYIRNPLLLLFALCWISDSAVLNFGPMPSIETRYLLAGIPLLCLMSGALLSRLLRYRFLSATVGFLLLLSSIGGCWLFHMTYLPANNAYRIANTWLDAYPELRTRPLYVPRSLGPVIRYAAEYDIELMAPDEKGRFAQPPEYVMSFFNGYFSREDLLAQFESCTLKILEGVDTGNSYLTDAMGRFRPKIGFEGSVVLYRVVDCASGSGSKVRGS